MPQTAIDTSTKNQFADHKEILKAAQALEQKGFKRPDYATFRAKVLEVFGIDLDTTKHNDVRLLAPYKMGRDESIGPCPVAIKNARFIDPYGGYVFREYDDNNKMVDIPVAEWNQDYKNYLYDYNQMLFYNDKVALARVQAAKNSDEKEVFGNLLYDYAYTGNEDLNKVLIGRISEEREGYENFRAAVYSVMHTKRGFGVRKNVLAKMVQLKPDLLIHAGELLRDVRSDWGSAPNAEEKQAVLQDVALLLDASLQAGIIGFAQELYDKDLEWKKSFQQEDYFQLAALRQFSEHDYRPESKRQAESQEDKEQVWLAQDPAYRDESKRKTAVIQDPDGYTNIRLYGRSTDSKIVGKLVNGEQFYCWKTPTDWWIVETKSGVRGFVHKSRIKEVK